MRNLLGITALSAGMMVSATSFAATQGTVGGTSTGDLDIQVTINDAVRISNLTDVVTTFTGTDISAPQTVCVYRNSTGDYNITATGDGGTGTEFKIADTGVEIDYAVSWNDGSGASAMTSNTALTGQQNADTSDPNCGGGDTATLTIGVLASDMVAVPTGVYTGTLTLTVAPE